MQCTKCRLYVVLTSKTRSSLARVENHVPPSTPRLFPDEQKKKKRERSHPVSGVRIVSKPGPKCLERVAAPRRLLASDADREGRDADEDGEERVGGSIWMGQLVCWGWGGKVYREMRYWAMFLAWWLVEGEWWGV